MTQWPEARGGVTALLLEWRQGDKAAFDRLVSVVYEELRRVARAHLRGERALTQAAQTRTVDVLALDEALDQLTSVEARLCQVVELRFFAGLNIDETAEALDVSTATVERDWVMAKAWLFQRLSPQP